MPLCRDPDCTFGTDGKRSGVSSGECYCAFHKGEAFLSNLGGEQQRTLVRTMNKLHRQPRHEDIEKAYACLGVFPKLRDSVPRAVRQGLAEDQYGNDDSTLDSQSSASKRVAVESPNAQPSEDAPGDAPKGVAVESPTAPTSEDAPGGPNDSNGRKLFFLLM